MKAFDHAQRASRPAVDDPGFHQSWFPVALARELETGVVLGVDVLGTRVVVYRGATGKPVVQSAWCPHLGADLSSGELVNNQIRCAYHHWRFDEAGVCAHIPTGDKIPPGASIFTYPTAEAWGLVWAFNGEKPLFDVPRIPGIEQYELVFEPRLRGIRPVPHWVPTSNGVDFQHLRTLHNLQTGAPDAIEVLDYSIEYCIQTASYMQHGLVTGTNVFAQHLRRGGANSFMLFAGAPVDQQCTRSFFVIGVPSDGDDGDLQSQTVSAKLQGLRSFVEKLLAEDEPILNTMRFKQGVMVASDRHLSRYLKYISEFPKFMPPAG